MYEVKCICLADNTTSKSISFPTVEADLFHVVTLNQIYNLVILDYNWDHANSNPKYPAYPLDKVAAYNAIDSGGPSPYPGTERPEMFRMPIWGTSYLRPQLTVAMLETGGPPRYLH